MSNIEKSNVTIILAGIAVGILCCVISVVTTYLVFRKPAEPTIAPGLIGGACNSGKCTAPNSICKFNMCYEQCKGRNAWPCDSDGDIPYIKTYWCDYSGCPAWQPPKSQTAIAAESKPKSSMFDEALKQQQAIDAETAAIKIAQQKLQLTQQEAAIAQGAVAQSQIASACQCQKYVGGQTGCKVGVNDRDGDDVQPWCYVQGGTQCPTATKSKNDKMQASAWRACNPNVDK
jgi:hypothetical protein